MVYYTEYTDNYSYLSGSITFSAAGLAGVYELTKSFINSLLPENFIKEGTLVWKGTSLEFKDESSYHDLLKEYWNIIFLLVFILTLVIFVPICGLIVCCCRCCGYCGGKDSPSNKRRDLKFKIVLAILFIICFGIFVFGMVGAFASNQEIREGATEFPDNGEKVHTDTISYFQSIKDQAKILLKVNYGEFGDAFKDTIKESGKNIVEQLSGGKTSAILKIFNFLEVLPILSKNLTDLNNIMLNLTSRENSITEGVETIKTDLAETLTSCPDIFFSQCDGITNAISSLTINVNFTNLPNVSQVIDRIDSLNIDSITEAAAAGRNVLENLENTINTTLSDIIQQTSDKIDEAGTEIDNYSVILDDTISQITTNDISLNTTIPDGYQYIIDYSPYFYYVGLALCCILLLVVVCLLLGLVLGVFGKRPEKFANNCCTKKSGSLCLMSAVVIIFIFTSIVGLTTFVMLVIGVSVDRGVCYPLRNPETSTIMSLIDNYVEENNADIEYKVSDVLSKCYKNQSIYHVFNLESKFNTTELMSQFNISDSMQNILDEIEKKWDTFFSSGFKILDDDQIKTLNLLTEIDLDINVTVFQNELNQSISNSDLDIIINILETLAAASSQYPNFTDSLRNNIEYIKIYNDTVLQPTIMDAQNALELAVIVDEAIKMNSTSFSEAIKQFLEDVDSAQTELQKPFNREAVSNYTQEVEDLVNGYINRVVNVLEEELGRCGPLNVAIHSLLIAVCDKVALPWNGFWVSLFICLVNFVPIIILSIWLSSLYKKYKPNVQNNERRRSLNNKNRTSRNDGTIPVDLNFYGETHNNNKNIDYYQGASAPKVLEHHNSRYDDMTHSWTQDTQLKEYRWDYTANKIK